MIRTHLPIVVTVFLIVAATVVEAQFSDRFTDTNVNAEEFGDRFADVPMNVGDWEGEDQKVEAEVLDTAGAVRHVNRTYTNTSTGETVGVWLIVGHARDVCRHTPNICYPNQGFRQQGSVMKHVVSAPAEEDATFYTCKFVQESARGMQRTRVFWAWNGNSEGQDAWEAPDRQRLHFGNNRALYKLYFTTNVGLDEDEISDSVAIDFAEVMLPEINRALFPERFGQVPSAEAEDPSGA